MIDAQYQFPEYYNWPFFFTIQKHEITREKQLQMWVDLTLNFCREKKIFKLTKSNFLNTLGINKTISRKLNIDSVCLIFDYAIEKNIFQQIKKESKEEVYILWRSIKDWGIYIHDCAIKQHKIDSLETLDHVIYDELFITEDFYKMDKDFLIVILLAAEKNNLCELLDDDYGQLTAVKFIKNNVNK